MKGLTKDERIMLSKALSYISKAEKLLRKLQPFSTKKYDKCKNCKKKHLRKGYQPEGMEFGIIKRSK